MKRVSAFVLAVVLLLSVLPGVNGLETEHSATALKGTPTIDGCLNEWGYCESYAIEERVGNGTAETTGWIKLMWDDNALYIGGQMADATQDSNDMFKVLLDFDGVAESNNAVDFSKRPHAGAYSYMLWGYWFNNNDPKNPNPFQAINAYRGDGYASGSDVLGDNATYNSVVTNYENGCYTFEIRLIPTAEMKAKLTADSTIGFDFRWTDRNDAENADDPRNTTVGWASSQESWGTDLRTVGAVTLQDSPNAEPYAQAVKGTPVLNGELDEWAADKKHELTRRPVNGTAENIGWYKIKWDEDAIYLAGHIQDDTLDANNDIVKILLDFDGQADGAQPVSFAERQHAGVYSWMTWGHSGGGSPEQPVVWNPKNAYGQTYAAGNAVLGDGETANSYVWKYVDGCYNFELKLIPAPELKEKLTAGTQLGFDIQWVDFNNALGAEDSRNTTIGWASPYADWSEDLRSVGLVTFADHPDIMVQPATEGSAVMLTPKRTSTAITLAWEPTAGTETYLVHLFSVTGEAGAETYQYMATEYTAAESAVFQELDPNSRYAVQVVPLSADSAQLAVYEVQHLTTLLYDSAETELRPAEATALRGTATVDGSLSEWKLTEKNMLQQRVVDGTAQTTGWFRLMWDDDAIYIGGQILDATPEDSDMFKVILDFDGSPAAEADATLGTRTHAGVYSNMLWGWWFHDNNAKNPSPFNAINAFRGDSLPWGNDILGDDVHDNSVAYQYENGCYTFEVSLVPTPEMKEKLKDTQTIGFDFRWIDCNGAANDGDPNNTTVGWASEHMDWQDDLSTIGKVHLEQPKGAVRASLTLNSVLGVNFKTDGDYTVKVAVGDAPEQTVACDHGTYTANVFAQDMMKPITASFYVPGAEEPAMTKVFRLNDYIAAVLAMDDVSQTTKDLAEAVLTFCRYAANCKGNDPGTLDPLAEIPAGAFDAYTPQVTGSLPGARMYAYIEEACRLCLSLPAEYADCTVRIDGKAVTGTLQEDGTCVYVSETLLPQDYNVAHKFTVLRGAETLLECDYSLLTYIGTALSINGGSEEVHDLLIAMYHYWSAAEAYEAENGSRSDWDEDWSDENISVQDLGAWENDAFPVDLCYDWGSCILNVDGVYKMWWTRSSPWDGVWYAESTDLKHWTNLQIVFRMRSVKENTTYIKQHLADPAVIYLDGTYYFWFETCSTADWYGSAMGDGTIVHATSKDGIHLDWYGGDDPLPVMQPEADRWNQGLYGSGMPSVIYKDGEFMMYYYDGYDDVMRLAISKDGIHFPANQENPIVFNKAGAGFTYNTLTGKYMMTICANPQARDPNAVDNEVVYVQESVDGIHWEYPTWQDMTASPLVVSSDAPKMRSFSEFVKNPYGMVDAPTMYMTYTEGDKPKAGEWWMSTSDTFELHYAAVNLPTYAKRPIDLPNGERCSAETLENYADRSVNWYTRSGIAKVGTPVIDGVAESVWMQTLTMPIDRAAGLPAMQPTDTRGEIRALWDENALYLYAEVSDAVLSGKDGLVIYVDVPRIRDADAGEDRAEDCYAINLSASGSIKITNLTGKQDLTDQFDCAAVVRQTAAGYVIEAKCAWSEQVKALIAENKVIGFDAAICDDMGSGNQDAYIAWSDYSKTGYLDHTVLGNLTLIN